MVINNIFIFLVILMISVVYAQTRQMPAHHTADGFRNPFPTYEDRDFADFLQWSLIDRIKGKKPDKPDSYNFETVKNNGEFLRENSDAYSITWIGHSTLLVQMEGLNILTDPIWSDRCSPLQFIGPKRHAPPGVAFEDLPPIDVVLISHNHYDHLDRLTIEQLGNDPLYLVPLGIGNFLQDIGIQHYEELDWWESVTFNGKKFVCTPAQHFSNRSMFDRNKTLWSSWAVIGEERKFYFAGDTGYFPGFKEIAERFGPFDIAAIPIGAYLPRWFMSPVHLSPQEAVQAFLDLDAQIFVPVHWGTFELADEPLDNPVKVLRKEIELRSLNPQAFWILRHGETRIYKNESRMAQQTLINSERSY
jgi:N-acyl-phosphatidylethanolamine-hydrolysing phospholipase D